MDSFELVVRLAAVGILLTAANAARALRDAMSTAEPKGADKISRWWAARTHRTVFWAQFGVMDQSWRNKYRDYPRDMRARFWGATTFLVWLTDLWHLAQAITTAAAYAAVVVVATAPAPVRWWVLLALVPAQAVFEPLYRWARPTQKKN